MDRGGSTPAVDHQYRVGFFARVLTAVDYCEIALSGGGLVLSGRGGDAESILPEGLIPFVRRSPGLVWTRLVLKRRNGRELELRGIRKSEAQLLHERLDAWLAPARAAYFAAIDDQLAAAEHQVATLLGATRYVRTGEVPRAVAALTTALRQVARDLDVPDRPESLIDRHARLEKGLPHMATRIAEGNERFVESALVTYGGLFDTVESKPLTAAQRRACVIDDDHNLVLAGAGTGKTSVMIGRVGYLLAAGLAQPESVLMVAYNRDAAQELRERAARRLGGTAEAERLTIKTFHALGVELIAEAEGVRPSVSALAEDDVARAKFVTQRVDEALQDSAYAAKFIEYGFDRHEAHRSIFDFASIEDYERELARLDLRTLRGERVKSYEEVRIANFLTKNGIEYRYEEPFPVDTATRSHRQYRPDFTLLREDREAAPLYLEHFGVDAQGNPPPFFGPAAAQRYREQMGWKRDLYRRYQMALVETYSYEFQSGEVFERLAARLAEHGIECRARSQAECLDMLRESGVVPRTAEFFAELIPRVRENALEASEVRQRISALPDHERVRAGLLWDLLQPILAAYEAHLMQRGEIDFAEMIRRAVDYIQAGRVRSPYSHVLVDEFQDISRPRADLVLALTRSRPGSSLFCVGDDWQSIYRFAGSDIRYTSEFERRVGGGSRTALDRTFRFNDQIGRVAADFVTRNPAQMKKDIASPVTVTRPAVSLVPTAEPVLGLGAVLQRIDRWAAQKGKTYSVYVLARYRYELDLLRKAFGRSFQARFPGVASLEFSTVHGAKGLEADFVVVSGLEEGRNGFPADKPTDAFHELFLPPKEAFAFAEERRLFYVALTRARHRVYLMYDAVTHSPFVRELTSGGYPIEQHELSGDFLQDAVPVVPCPRCATGEIRPKTGPHGLFFGCHRFPVCRYKERGCGSCGGLLLRVADYCVCSHPRCDGVHLACPKCGAPMERRSGRYGVFFGCSKFGTVDLLEQCAATQKWRELPRAEELRARASK